MLKPKTVKRSKLIYADNENIKLLSGDHIDDYVEYLFQKCEKMIGKPASNMTKYDKINAIKFLSNMGIFYIVTAEKKICKFLNISKFTLHNYLNSIRNNEKLL